MKIVTGIGFNHESPIRHEQFITRKLSIAAARMAVNQSDRKPVQVGNLNAYRDWGHALDFCHAFYLISQQSDNEFAYVISTNTTI